jgi:hypothetical protein
MTASDQLSRITPYVGRLLEDEYIQEQIGQAITGLRKSSRRVKRHNASGALQDRRLRRQLHDAVGSLTAAGRALTQPPAPKRHRLRNGLALVVSVSAVALAWQNRSALIRQINARGGQAG